MTLSDFIGALRSEHERKPGEWKIIVPDRIPSKELLRCRQYTMTFCPLTWLANRAGRWYESRYYAWAGKDLGLNEEDIRRIVDAADNPQKEGATGVLRQRMLEAVGLEAA